MFRKNHIRLTDVKEVKPALQLISQGFSMPIPIAQEISGIGLRKGLDFGRGLPYRCAQDLARVVPKARHSVNDIRYTIGHLTPPLYQRQTNGGKPKEVSKSAAQFPTAQNASHRVSPSASRRLPCQTCGRLKG